MSEIDIISLFITTASEGGSNFNWAFVIKHAVNLGILVGLLVYLLRKPVGSFLESRRANLSKEIDEAKKAIEEAKEKYEQFSDKLNSLESEVSSLKESIRQQGEQEKADIIKQAENTCELIKKETKDTIELESLRAKRDVQEEVIVSSISQAHELIKSNIDSSDVTKSIDKFVKLVEEGKWLQ